MATELHPTAVYCLLKGLVAVKPNFACGEAAYRIAPHGTRLGNGRLYFDPDNRRWYVIHGHHVDKLYTVVSIATIPHDVMGKLPIQMIDQLIDQQEN